VHLPADTVGLLEKLSLGLAVVAAFAAAGLIAFASNQLIPAHAHR